MKRAEAVAAHLAAAGVAPDRLEARGFGEEQPKVPNDTPENMRANRRTELTPIR